MTPITVLFFATLRDRAGTRSVSLELPAGATVADLKQQLKDHLPALQGLGDSSLVAINHEYVFDHDLVPAGAEVAIFPPVSGG